MNCPQKYFTKQHIASAIAVFTVVVIGISYSRTAYATTGINRTINFQGKLVDSTGVNVADSTYSVVFAIYDRSSSGTTLWSETQSVSTVDGIFHVALGSSTPIPANFNFNWDGLYLGIKVGADAEMTPRIRMAAVPYAFNAEKVAGLTITDENGVASTSGTLKIPNGKTISFGGAFATTAGNDLTFTTTGNTILGLGGTGSLTLVDTSTSQTITNKIIGNTGLTFTGATTDITTGTDENFVLNPDGLGLIGLGITSPDAFFHVYGGTQGGNALAIFDQRGATTNDIFTASSAGITKFALSNTGVFRLTNGETIDNTSVDDTIILGSNAANGAGVLRVPVKSTTGDPSLNAGGNMYYNVADGKFRCYQGGWVDCISSANIQSTEETASDTLSTTESDVLSLSITPKSTSSQIWIVGTVEINGDGNTNRTVAARIKRGASCAAGTQIGVDLHAQTDYSADSGVITLNFVDIPGTATSTTYHICADTDAGSPTASNKSLTLYEPMGGAEAAGVGTLTVRESDSSPSVPTVTTIEFGPTSTSTDQFIVSNQSGGVARVALGNQVAMLNQAETVTGGWNFGTLATTFTTVINANGGITTSTADQSLGFSANGTGNILLTTDHDTRVGIGTTNPLATLYVAGTYGDNAALIIDQLNAGDLFTASASGLPTFTITNAGGIKLGSSVGTGVQCLLGGTTASWGSCGSSQWTTSGSNIFFNTGNVGIGDHAAAATPLHLLSLAGTTTGNAALMVDQRTSTGDIITASVSGSTKFVINNSGNIGVGTSSPMTLLHLYDTRGGNASLIVDQQNISADIFTASSAGTAKFTITKDGGIKLGANEGLSGECLLSGGANSQAAWGECGGGAAGAGGGGAHAVYSASSGTNVNVVFSGAEDSAPSLVGSTLTLPSNTTKIQVEVKGGGGGGGGVSNVNAIKVAGGGGEGGYSQELVSSLGSSYYYTVGTGGTAGATSGGTGGTGNSTCFGTNSTACTTPMVSATGGAGGVGSTAVGVRAGGVGGTGTGGDVNLTGTPGNNSSSVANAVWGGAGGGVGGGIATTAAGNGVAGANGGGGAGGAQVTAATTTRTGGAGGSGYVVIYIYTSSSEAGGTSYLQRNGTVLAPGGSATVTDQFVLGGNTSTDHQLEVNGKITGKALVSFNETGDQAIFTASSSGQTKFVIDHTGNIGIGTTSPTASLDILTSALTSTGAKGALLTSTFTPTAGGSQHGLYLNINNFPSTTGNTAYGMYTNLIDDSALGSSNTLYGSYTSLAFSGNGPKNGYGAQYNVTDSSNTSGNLYGINLGISRTGDTNLAVTKTIGLQISSQTIGAATTATQNIYGADITVGTSNQVSGTANVYGLRIKSAGSTVAGGTLNHYGIYIDSQSMDTTGTTTNTGLYVAAATGADTNYAAIFAGGSIGIGTTAPTSQVNITRDLSLGATGKALLGLDQLEDQDIFTASHSGTPKFTITKDGGLVLGTSTGSNGDCLKSSGADAAAAWGSCAGGSFSLKNAYDGDADGSDATILLTSTDGSIIFENAAGTQQKFTMAAATAATIDLVAITNTGASQATSTTGADGLQIDFANAGSGAITNSGLTINATSNNTNASSVLYGLNIGNLTSGGESSSEIALRIGTGWDQGIVIETGSNDGTGFVYSGGGRPTKTITLSPEYPGAVLTAFYGEGTDTNITGSMISDADTTQGTSIRNYYQWERTVDATQHFYTVAVRVKLPKDFNEWATSNAVTVAYQTESATNTVSDLDVRIYNESSSTIVDSLTDQSSTSWATAVFDDTELNDGGVSDWDAADQTAVIYLRMGSASSNYVRIGDITLNYLASF